MDNIDKFLINLKSISSIKEHNKFYINNEKLIIIKKDDLLFSIYRFYYNIDRNKNIENLILIYNEIFLYINHILNSKINFYYYIEFETNIENNTLSLYNINSNDENDNNSLDMCRKLLDLKIAINDSIQGLKNLKLIYINCNIIHSKLDILINNINNNIFKINRKIYNK
jgi:hypothetical protein